MKRIFYSNITYRCNNHCIFCYSHNTKLTNKALNEISAENYIQYMEQNTLTKNDRVIINGGEPLLHKNISRILEYLNSVGCEILIYTNGRALRNIHSNFISNRMRFIIPIHGPENLHDHITRINHSYSETIQGITYLAEQNCITDIKVIITNQMLENGIQNTINTLKSIKFNGSLHITKMDYTPVARSNNIQPPNMQSVAKYTKKLFDSFHDEHPIRIYDSCIKELSQLTKANIFFSENEIKVYFKDDLHEFIIDLQTPKKDCTNNCPLRNFCKSAVSEYLTLHIKNNIPLIDLE